MAHPQQCNTTHTVVHTGHTVGRHFEDETLTKATLCLADLTQTTDGAVVSCDVGGTTYLRTVAAAVVFIDQAPPATTFLHALQSQIPTALRFTVSLPQNEHV